MFTRVVGFRPTPVYSGCTPPFLITAVDTNEERQEKYAIEVAHNVGAKKQRSQTMISEPFHRSKQRLPASDYKSKVERSQYFLFDIMENTKQLLVIGGLLWLFVALWL